ncbi:hypothetical protein [Acidovorax sp. BLS4]|uniref:hypothetical protein n=1 Tax=Acidovorax sp. BLS4 TaxID=3273430 RepID=UPI002943D721|nr:hypothetical protein [Paracidovorax avenae]WOI45600.1 hypothetical protein R1Z03_24630 [Paracidovorax avenae]
MCIKLLPANGLYREQRERLRDATLEERMEFEELAAHLEFECNEKKPHAERLAYCHIQWVRKWHTKSYCPIDRWC